MPKPRDLPKLPEGWFWHEGSKVTSPSYLATPRITLEGPGKAGVSNMNTSIGAPTVMPTKGQGIIYSVGLKKLSACCGGGHAVHFLYPSKPEVDKMALMLQAIEEQNAVCSRNMNMFTLILRNKWAQPAIEACKQLGWERAFKFRNMVWHQNDPNNSVQLWFKDGTDTYNRFMKEDDPQFKPITSAVPDEYVS